MGPLRLESVLWSAVGYTNVPYVTGEKFDLCNTGWSSFVQTPEVARPECQGDHRVTVLYSWSGWSSSRRVITNRCLSGYDGKTPYSFSHDGLEWKDDQRNISWC